MVVRESLMITGRIRTGMGRGKFFLSKGGYRAQFIRKLGIDPAKGSLNIHVDVPSKLSLLEGSEGITIEGFREGDDEFGEVVAFEAEIEGLKAAAIIPRKTSHVDVLEVVSEYDLRRELHLEDGDRISVTVYL